MLLCQYEFQFQNEYMGFLEQKIGDLLEIADNHETLKRIDVEQHSFIMRKKNAANFMLFSANKSSYVYLVIIRCETKYENQVKNILLELCNEIEADYGEDHRKEIKNVFGNSHNRFSQLEDKYRITQLFHI